MREYRFRAWDAISKTMHYDIICRGAAWNQILSHGGAGMQYTWLEDVNGVDIWEGDIIKTEHEEDVYCYQVIFCGGSFDVNDPSCCKHCENGTASHGSLNDTRIRPTEVVGNIYENPELLKRKDGE